MEFPVLYKQTNKYNNNNQKILKNKTKPTKNNKNFPLSNPTCKTKQKETVHVCFVLHVFLLCLFYCTIDKMKRLIYARQVL